MQIQQKRVTKLINHHKVVAFPPQPRVRRPFAAAVKSLWSLELQQVLC
ncbi:hypothetical protein ABH991_004941 [Bradyrhizobium ottawaense]|uniref:Transposase n=1 Tax=Bradyrhizobium ottawaense TaxID=931866 RepID=A0ABV4G3H8_9BRAD|nr:hypothetical protein [Bradyrhizobium sp. CIR3A]MBB4359652.1 hypothetical protein [Bradyrhizobium sp. CIR18]MBB4377810.1 hypothetical protein [Bradyrhizobium sp. SBR1B]MBB4391974.1 hypothetical protein [Bradyrhizobium sp. ERR14]MBB4422542.1 hypothetical protein [Bradyrhizobium sp. CIR48]NYG47616.1 hypothetical protein [Bradyrhizobium sp. IAR9]SFN02017.1 hypothetical protein SAMN05216573_10740 [Bradyrhizobium sp. Rc3b]